MAAIWYYSFNSEQHGPVTAKELRELIREDVLTEDSLVWKEGLEDWIPVARVRGVLERHGAAGTATRPKSPKPAAVQPAASAPVTPVAASPLQLPQPVQGFARYQPARGNVFGLVGHDVQDAVEFATRHPIRLALLNMVFGFACVLSLVGIVTTILIPVFWIGYVRYLHGLLKRTSPSYRDLIDFMRHGWDSLWHLAMLFAAMIITVSLVLTTAAVGVVILAGVGSAAVSISALSGTAEDDARPARVAPPPNAQDPANLRNILQGPGPGRAPVKDERTWSDWWSKHFWGLVVCLLSIPLYWGRALVGLLMLDVALAPRRAGPDRFDTAFDAFGRMLDAAWLNYGRLLFEGVTLFVLGALSTTVVDAVINSKALASPEWLFILFLINVAWYLVVDLFSVALAFVAASNMLSEVSQRPSGIVAPNP